MLFSHNSAVFPSWEHNRQITEPMVYSKLFQNLPASLIFIFLFFYWLEICAVVLSWPFIPLTLFAGRNRLWHDLLYSHSLIKAAARWRPATRGQLSVETGLSPHPEQKHAETINVIHQILDAERKKVSFQACCLGQLRKLPFSFQIKRQFF